MASTNQKKTLRTFALASFLNDLGSDAIRPLWPLFVTSVLGAPATVLGLLDGLGEVISYGSRMPAGLISDRFGKRKPLVWAGYLIAGLGRLGYALAPSVGWLFPFKAADRIGKIRDPPRDALLADITKPTQRGRAFGFLQAADHLGATVGPLFGLLLFGLLGFRWTFILAAIPSLIAAVCVLAFVREKKPSHHEILVDHYGKPFWRLALFSSLFGLGWISLSFMVLAAINLQGQSIAWSPVLFFVMSLCAVISSIITGRISDSVGRKKVLIASYLAYALVPTGFFIAQYLTPQGAYGIGLSLFLFSLYGLHYGAMSTVQPAFISDLIPSSHRASAMGTFQTIFGCSALAASVLAGALWDLFSPSAAFGAAAILSIVATMIFAVRMR